MNNTHVLSSEATSMKSLKLCPQNANREDEIRAAQKVNLSVSDEEFEERIRVNSRLCPDIAC